MRCSRSALALFSFFLILAVPAAKAAAASSADRKGHWKAKDVIFAESAAPQTRILPDAKWLVWVKSTGDKDKDA